MRLKGRWVVGRIRVTSGGLRRVGFALAIGISAQASAIAQRSQSLPSDPERLAVMQHHFTHVTRIHEALIRGDLRLARAEALELTRMPAPPEVPAVSRPLVDAIKFSAARVAAAGSVATAAEASVAMLLQCSRCHESVGVRPGPLKVQRPDVGGLVGHMLDHQRAADALLLGLVIPSSANWQEGAERLAVAELRGRDLPPDRNYTTDILAAETAVHTLATEAARASTPETRAVTYARLITTCAQCHSLHRQIWGPRSLVPER